MNPRNILKTAIGFVSSAGAGAVVGNVVKATTPIDMNKYQKVMVAVGSVVVSSMVSSHASKYAVDQFEQTAEQIKLVKQTIRPN